MGAAAIGHRSDFLSGGADLFSVINKAETMRLPENLGGFFFSKKMHVIILNGFQDLFVKSIHFAIGSEFLE